MSAELTLEGKKDLIASIGVIYKWFLEADNSPYGVDDDITKAVENIHFHGTSLQLEEYYETKPPTSSESVTPSISLLELAEECYSAAIEDMNVPLTIEADKWCKLLAASSKTKGG